MPASDASISPFLTQVSNRSCNQSQLAAVSGDWSRVGEWEWSGVPEGLQFTPDETQIWIGGERNDEGVLERVEVATGRVIQGLSADRLPIDGMALSRDGRWLAAASDEEQHLHLWDTTTGERRRTWELEDGSSRFLLRPDGQLLLREMRADSWQVEPVAQAMEPAADAPRREPVRTARIPFRLVVYPQEFEFADRQPGFFLQLAPGGFFECFVHFNEPARQRPCPLKRRPAATDQQHTRRRLARNQHEIHRHRRARIVVGKRLGHRIAPIRVMNPLL